MKDANKQLQSFNYKLKRPPVISKDDKRYSKYQKQLDKTGVCDIETWNLDTTFVQFMLPRLKRFRKVNVCYPSDMTMKQWNNILDKILKGFELHSVEHEKTLTKKEYKQIQTAFELFGKYIHQMWW